MSASLHLQNIINSIFIFFREQPTVERVELVYDVVLGEFGALYASFLHQLPAQGRVVDYGLEPLCYFRGLFGVGIEGGVASRLGHGGAVGGDDRGVAAERFEDGDAEPFVERHVGRGTGTGIEGGEVVEVGLADKMHPLCEAQ